MADQIPVLFDTDIGSDIDDAVALAYLLAELRCDLLGVTTVTGDVARRAALVQLLCEAAAKPDIPIHCGASEVLLDGRGQPEVPHYEAVRGLAHRLDWPRATAIDFLRRTIRERPGEVTLLSAGPLTNVALLFALDPEIPTLLRSWVSMAGDFRVDASAKDEWNARCDPYASAIAFRRTASRHVHIGLDVSLRCQLAAADVRARFKGPLLSLVLRMAEAWFAREGRSLIFHDPLAAAVLFDESLCDFHRGDVTVEPSTGRTAFSANPAGADEVAFDVRPDAFFERFFAAFE